jgi:hypothetical protein
VGGVQLDPLGTAAINRPIVPAQGDYDDADIGGMIDRGNRSTRRKPASMPLCPPQNPHGTRTRTRAADAGVLAQLCQFDSIPSVVWDP